MSLTFTIPGPPLSKARPRVTVRGTFMPKPYVAYKKHAALCCMTAPSARTWDAGAPAFRLEARFYLPTRRTSDVDNLCGAILDSLNGVAWKDDAAVVSIVGLRLYDKDNPRAEVRVEALTEQWITEEEARMCERWAEVLGS